MHLVIGPSNVGKSTWLKRNKIKNVQYAFQYQREGLPPEDSTLHYNLLLRAPLVFKKQGDVSEFDLLSDSFLKRCFDNDRVSFATVIVAPVAELIERAENRLAVEKHLSDRYRADIWLPILKSIDHLALYRQLCDLLEDHGVDYEILLNTCLLPNRMTLIERRKLKAALLGKIRVQE